MKHNQLGTMMLIVTTSAAPSVIGPILPSSLFEQTQTRSLTRETCDYFDSTSGGHPLAHEATATAMDLQQVYRATGLSWSQIASLLNVSTRAVHAWRSGAKNIAVENQEALNHLIKTAMRLRRHPVFQARAAFMELLNDARNLKRLRAGDLTVFESVVVKAKSAPTSVLVDANVPADPVTLMSSVPDDGAVQVSGKIRKARVLRRKAT